MTEPKFKFHSSVNSIPVVRELQFDNTQESNHNNVSSDIASYFADKTPQPLDHLAPDTYSGELRLTIETMTALITGEQHTHQNAPREISIQKDPITKNAIIPATMIKGMIANAYERITASRFRIFGDHSNPLTYRADPAAANNLIPIRLDEKYECGEHRGTLLYGPHQARFAKLYTFDGSTTLNSNLEIKHNSQVWFKATPVDSTYVVTAIWDNKSNTYKPLELPTNIAAQINQEKDINSESNEELNNPEKKEDGYKGWYYATTPDDLLKTNERIFSTKNSERIFFDDNSSQQSINISPEIAATYDRVILSYAYNSEENEKRPDKASRFVHERNNRGLIEAINHNGLLAYARIDNNKVIELFPTEVGRRNYPCAPRHLARRQNILPAKVLSEASPADRLFGFTPNSTTTTSDAIEPPTQSLKGKIRITDIDTSKLDPKTDEIIKENAINLRPLMSPNRSSARRFLTDTTGHTISRIARSKYYGDQHLLGAAAYLFLRKHAIATGDGSNRTFSEWNEEYENDVRKDGVSGPGHKLRTIAHSWIPRGQHFCCTLHFEGLSRNELRILLLITSSDLIGRYSSISNESIKEHPDGYLRMGMGKPFELGIVKVSHGQHAVYQTMSDRDHRGLVDDYSELSGCLGAPGDYLSDSTFGWNYDSFLQGADLFYRTLASTPSAKAFLRSCIGYTGKHEVRYMKLRENRWNNQTDPNTGGPKEENGIAPRPLVDNELWTRALSVGEAN